MSDAHALVIVVSAVSRTATVDSALAPRYDFIYSQQELRGALAAAVPLIAAVAWFLVLGYVLRRGRRTELALATSLGALTLSGLAFVTVPAFFGHARPDQSVWAALMGSACAAVLFALAAFVPRRPLRRPGWRAMPEAAVLEERRRIACDLHDGLAQEIAYLLRNLDSIEGTADQEMMAHLRQAAERAHLEVRLAIDSLAASHCQSVNAAVAQAVGEVAARDHIKLELDVIPDIRVSGTRAEALVRIASEAVSNAARHSGADSVSLRLERKGSRVRLRVSDNGSGFDPAVRGDGFGLTSMYHRASSVGGDLRISSVLGCGTEVEAML